MFTSGSSIKCAQCEQLFSRQLRFPYELPCSHIYCSVCLHMLYGNYEQIGCYICQESFGTDVEGSTQKRFDIIQSIEKSQRSIESKALFPLSPSHSRNTSPRSPFSRLTTQSPFRPKAQTAPRFSLPRSKSPRGGTLFAPSSQPRENISSRQTLRFDSPSPGRLSSSERRHTAFQTAKTLPFKKAWTSARSSPLGNRHLSKFEPQSQLFPSKESRQPIMRGITLKSRNTSPIRHSFSQKESIRPKDLNPKLYCDFPECEEKRASLNGETSPFCSKNCEYKFYGHKRETCWNHIYHQTGIFSKKGFSSRPTTPKADYFGRSPTSIRFKTARDESPKCDNQQCNNTVSGEHEIDEFSFCSNRCFRAYLNYREF